MNEAVNNFKPITISVVLGENEYVLKYDLNAFCEMERIYDSVDDVLKMLLGTDDVPDLDAVTYCDAPVLASDIAIAGVPLSEYIQKFNRGVRAPKHEDTRNLLWLGVLHDHSVFDEHGEIVGYTIGKAELGKHITLSNMREVNAKIVTVLLRDLIPAQTGNSKNVEEASTLEQATE